MVPMMVHLSLLQDIFAVISGLLVGFSLGLIGGGGSILAVPLLAYFVGYPDPHVVIGTTALAVGINAYLNLIPHARAGNVRWRAAIVFAIAGVIAALGGSILGKAVGGHKLLFLFAILMLVVAFLMTRPRAERTGDVIKRPVAVETAWLIVVGAGAGLLSGFFGIGGGFLIVPGLMLATGMPILAAIGTSLFSVGSFGMTTALSYAWSGLVDWRVAALYILGGVAGGWIGARLATHLGKNKKALNWIFAVIVALTAIYMLYRNLAAFHL
jgi:uncharacterized membrane protein YfcA